MSLFDPFGMAEFGESRPIMWEYLRKRFWHRHWKVEDLDNARDPKRRAEYERWLFNVKAGKVKGRNPNDY